MSGMFSTGENARAQKSDEWYTPRWVFDAIGITFDLDPASPHDHATPVPAEVKLTIFDNGLKSPWHGRVWLNPPYGRKIGAWVRRLIDHGDGIALVFSRTDAAWCQEAMQAATAMLFLAGRIDFTPGTGSKKNSAGGSGAGSLFLAYGDECADALQRMAGRGIFIRK